MRKSVMMKNVHSSNYTNRVNPLRIDSLFYLVESLLESCTGMMVTSGPSFPSTQSNKQAQAFVARSLGLRSMEVIAGEAIEEYGVLSKQIVHVITKRKCDIPFCINRNM